VTTPRTASQTRRVVVSSSARRDVPCAVGKKSSHHRARPLAVSWTAPRATSRRDRRFAKARASIDDDDAKEDADARPASEKRPASGDVRPPGDEKPPEPSPNDDETESDANLLELLNLLVLTGGVKGSLAVVLGYFAGINALGLIHPDVASTAHGFAFAAPVLFLDALVMVPRWDVSEAKEDAIERGEVPLGKIEKIQRALSKYQREEALSNPCRSMPAYQDAIVAATARLTDEMLERAVVLGFLGAWICDRAVEAGVEPFEAEDPSKYVAVVLVYLYLEVRLRSAAKRTKQTMRAFRVERDKITGKQKMVPMDDSELDAAMNKNKGSASNANDSLETSTPTPRSEALEREVLSAVEAVESARADEPNPSRDDDKDDKGARRESKPPSPDGPLVLSPGQLGASPVGSLMFNQSVKQFFDGFRSRVTLVTQCTCFATAADANLWGPIAGGLACDVLFIAYQRLCMSRFFDAAGVAPPRGRPATEREIKKTQMTLLRKDLERRRSALAGKLMDSVDKSPAAAGAREINVLMREVVREVQNAKAFEKEADALTFVLDRIHKDFPPSRLDAMSEGESVETMRTVLAEIRAEMRTLRDGSRSGESAETPETDDAASNDSTASAADSSSADETRTDASVAEETATETETETETEKPPPVGTSVGKRAVSLTDLASLARSNEAAPPESIWEAARREKRAEKPGEPTAGNRDEDLATPEPLRGKNATWDALDRLTNAVTEKLQSEDEGDAAE
jgi:hypothetical protein